MVVRLTEYSSALDYLFARTTGAIRPGLERTELLLDALGRPQDSFRSFHIAGTNGKGSVAAILEALLRARGYAVGKYTSPHLVDFRERIVINNAMIDEAFVVDFVERWTGLIEKIGATFFEATTAMALHAFAHEGVQVAVVETGLGGRLDSTNLVNPLVAAVTSIGWDHMEYLGDSLKEIAEEKAGIFKRGKPAVIGERDPYLTEVLRSCAERKESAPICVVSEISAIEAVSTDVTGTRFRLTSPYLNGEVHVGLPGEHQAWNTVTALTSLHAAGGAFTPRPADIDTLLPRVTLPGRLQVAGDVILDVAHNPDGARVVAQSVRTLYPTDPFTILLCVLSDKDWPGILRSLAAIRGEFIFTDAPTAPAGRKWELAAVAETGSGMGLRYVVIRDFDAALEAARRRGGKLLVTGSFHTVGDAMARLQLSPFTR